jgi:uncharacterized protein (TIGR02147 family)
VLGGKRDLNLDQAYELINDIGLGELESEYFFAMLSSERAGTAKLRNYLKGKLEKLRLESLKLSSRLSHERKLSDRESAVFYSSWIYTAVWLLTSFDDGQTIESICERFDLERERVIEVLKFLQEVGLVEEKLGRFRSSPQRTHLEKTSPFLARHHSNWRMKGIQRAEDLKDDEIMFSGPLSISSADFKKVREQIVELIQSVSKTVKDTKPEDIAVFAVDLFWMK